jgi:hypothetical protein
MTTVFEEHSRFVHRTWSSRLSIDAMSEGHYLKAGSAPSKITIATIPVLAFTRATDGFGRTEINADNYLKNYGALPHAILLLGETGLLAVSRKPNQNKGLSIVGVTKNNFTEIGNMAESNSASSIEIGRLLLAEIFGCIDMRISETHAAISQTTDGLTTIEDQSSNGTRVITSPGATVAP